MQEDNKGKSGGSSRLVVGGAARRVVARVLGVLDDDDAAVGELVAPQTAQELRGLAAEHRPKDHLDRPRLLRCCHRRHTRGK